MYANLKILKCIWLRKLELKLVEFFISKLSTRFTISSLLFISGSRLFSLIFICLIILYNLFFLFSYELLFLLLRYFLLVLVHSLECLLLLLHLMLFHCPRLHVVIRQRRSSLTACGSCGHSLLIIDEFLKIKGLNLVREIYLQGSIGPVSCS